MRVKFKLNRIEKANKKGFLLKRLTISEYNPPFFQSSPQII